MASVVLLRTFLFFCHLEPVYVKTKGTDIDSEQQDIYDSQWLIFLGSQRSSKNGIYEKEIYISIMCFCYVWFDKLVMHGYPCWIDRQTKKNRTGILSRWV